MIIMVLMKMVFIKILVKDINTNGFSIDGIHINNNYNLNGFNRRGIHKDTKDKYDLNDFDRNGIHKDTKDKYDLNGFNRDAGTFFNKENVINEIYQKILVG